MKMVSALRFELDEFNTFLEKVTLGKMQMEVDWDNNEWVWDKTGHEITEFNILNIISTYLKKDVEEVVVEIDGYFSECKILVVLK